MIEKDLKIIMSEIKLACAFENGRNIVARFLPEMSVLARNESCPFFARFWLPKTGEIFLPVFVPKCPVLAKTLKTHFSI